MTEPEATDETADERDDGSDPGPGAIFDAARQAELARSLEQIDARPPVDRADVFTRASRTLAPPPTVVTVFADSDADADPGADDDSAD